MYKKKKMTKFAILMLSVMLTMTMGFGSTFTAFAETKEPPVHDDAIQVDVKGEVDEDAEVKAIKKSTSDEVTYGPIYLLKHGNNKYADFTKIDLSSFARPVTVARGVATYNFEKEDTFEISGNNIMAMDYEIPVYDIDKDSDYYIALPNVNMGSSRFGFYDFQLTYDNHRGDIIEGDIFEDNIAYIPKDAVDNPKNKYPLISDSVLAMQLNYYIKKDAEDIFSKAVPVQILKGKTPEYKTVQVENMFADDSISFPIGDYDKSQLTVMLNGTVLPISKEAWDVNDGLLTIYSSAAIIGSINVVAKEKPVAERVTGFFTESAFADKRTEPDDMKYYKTESGDEVIISSNLSKMYVGWRGSYTANNPIKRLSVNNIDMSNFTKLDEWENSLKYIYGAYTPDETGSQRFRGYWAICSYTKGVDVKSGKTIVKATEYDNPFDSSTTKKTMYDWLLYWADRMEKGNAQTDTDNNGRLKRNNIGGYYNFGIPFPTGKIKGDDRNLVSDTDAEGYANTSSGNPNITFDAENDEGKTVLKKGSYMAASCAHIDDDAVPGGTNDDAGKRTVYVSCLAKGTDYVVLAFAWEGDGVMTQEGMGIYKFRTTPPSGKFTLTKSTKDIVYPNIAPELYKFENARFTLYEDEDCKKVAKYPDGTDIVVKTDEDGKAVSEEIEEGTYWLKETRAPYGFQLNEEPFEVEIIPNKTVVTKGLREKKYIDDKISVPPTGSFEFKKVDADTGKPEPQGNGTLKGTTFKMEYFANINGDTGGAPKRTWIMKTIDATGVVKYEDKYKESGPDLIKTGENGDGTPIPPVGTYRITEYSEGSGYNKSSGELKAVITAPLDDDGSGNRHVNVNWEGGNDTIRAVNHIKRFGIKFPKYDNDLSSAYAQGDATLEGAEYTITNASPKSIVTRSATYLTDATPAVDWSKSAGSLPAGAKEVSPGAVAGIMKTKADGIAQTLNTDLPYGKYTIKETKPSPGYLLNEKWQFTIDVYNDNGTDKVKITGTNNDDGPVEKILNFTDGMLVDLTEWPSREEVIRSGIQIVKQDKELSKSEALGGAHLNDIIFTIKNKSAHDVVVRKDTFEIKTDQYNPGPQDFLIDDEKLAAAGTTELLKGKPTGKKIDWAKLSSKNGMFGKDIKRVAPGQDVGKIVAHWNEEKKAYTAETLPDDLPYGTYSIRESRTNDTYQRTDKEEHIFSVNKNGKVYSEDDNEIFVFSNYVYRSHLDIHKHMLGGRRGDYIPFKITMKKTGESHVMVMDKNGDATTKDSRTTDSMNEDEGASNEIKINPFDDLLEVEEITTEMIAKRTKELAMPIWFSKGEFGSDAEYDPKWGALPYGEYEIEELPCESNEGYKLIKFDIMVDEKSQFGQEDMDAENVEEFEIRTTATADGRKTALATSNFTLTDKVEIIGSKKAEYRLVGTLMDKETNSPVLDKDGKPITAEKTFTGPKKEATMDFTFDATTLKGHDVVVFEKLYETAPDGSKRETKHEDLADEGQTVHIPGAETTAATEDGKKEFMISEEEEVTMVDTIKYTNLIPGERYTATGYLFDADTLSPLTNEGTKKEKRVNDKKEIIKNDDGSITVKTIYATKSFATIDGENIDIDKLEDLGSAITSTVEFVPEERNGEVKVEFKFKKNALYGTRIVTFEDIKETPAEGPKYRVAVHAHWDDESQITYIPKIGTKASVDGKNADVKPNKDITLVDTVSYENLEPGKEHTVKGVLMDKSTGQPAMDSDGKEITTEAKFTPETPSGTVEMTFTFKGETVQGRKIVAFERVYDAYGRLVAKHEDINDKDQTVTFKPMTPEKLPSGETEVPEKKIKKVKKLKKILNTPVVDTGDDTPVPFKYILMLALSVLGLVILIKAARKSS